MILVYLTHANIAEMSTLRTCQDEFGAGVSISKIKEFLSQGHENYHIMANYCVTMISSSTLFEL